MAARRRLYVRPSDGSGRQDELDMTARGNPSIAPANLGRLVAWLRTEVLPFWATTGLDDRTGGFHERLTLDGRPILDVPIRLLTQARQTYVFAEAHLRRWLPGADRLARRGAEHMLEGYRSPDGAPGYVFSVDDKMRPVDPTRDFYAHAFVLFALAAAYRVTQETRFREAAEEILRVLDGLFAAPNGGLVEAVPPNGAWRRQNPHMHLFEAHLAWFEATGEPAFLARAGEIFGLFTTRFFSAREGMLREYFTEDWQPAPAPAGRIWEPGHHCEWVWLLRRFETLSGRTVDRPADILFERAMSAGVDQRGFLRDEMLDDGTPHLTSTRCWPLTEAIKAAAAEHEAGRDGMPAIADRLGAALMAHAIPGACRGGWVDQRHVDGTPRVAYVPATTLYHFVLAIAEAERVFGADGPAAAPDPASRSGAGATEIAFPRE